jgi:hypothetical protein
MGRIFYKKVYTHPASPRHFFSEHDARGWCADHGESPRRIEVYDSKAEYDRWCWLVAQQRIGNISGLRRQVQYELVPEQVRTVPVGEKVVKVWWVDGIKFRTKSDAQLHCRRHAIKMKDITWYEERQPVTKRVVDERAVTYVADFVYFNEYGVQVVEDVKSDYTRKEKDYIIKRKLMLWRWKIRINEVVM